MTEQTKSVFAILRVVMPILMFVVLLGVLHWSFGMPLVLATVIACLVAIVDFVVLTWMMNRPNDAA